MSWDYFSAAIMNAILDAPPAGAHKLEWFVLAEESAFDGEQKLRAYGIKCWSRQLESEEPLIASVWVAGDQRKWAEELLFVAAPRRTSAGKMLDSTARAIAKRAAYTPQRKWQAKPVHAGSIVGRFMAMFD